MVEKVISQYINKITKKDVLDFAQKKDIELNNDELEFIFSKIKNNWKTIIFGDPSSIFEELKTKTSTQKYNQIEQLYYEFKKKYRAYL